MIQNIEVVLCNIGLLLSLDGHMNIAMENAEEIINDEVTNRYPSVFIRGNNGKIIISYSFFNKFISKQNK